MYKNGATTALQRDTINTNGHIAFQYTLLGNPNTRYKQVIKAPPDATVLMKALKIGITFSLPIFKLEI